MSRALGLYRNILKFHKDRLPLEMRKLGDEYVRNEFRLHKSTTKPEQLRDFFGAWDNYLLTMRGSGATFGKDISKEDTKKMNDEQRIQLAQLKGEAKGASS
ncbi:hypothetical protein B484DRAFT_348368 [Ochromonadaceae sp. CCMP2298]|nr:hypothetical protein B484DRAFT_348368 [Ochromonadaceae sp. CCMP2298]|mmetsp:Transcript_12074/g.26891  ORF Transcript_12074/g.26891 Transcript_12074/m.26891 type:complete len:101 (+) Transcript_12074:150-452(+)|eukprot:CAMPEP_0173198106 /NCGR_PEP_ID=MMETSP1141-20130122/16513_1 /TAXON_ID=483371 /ORGANISM="non described non described, Strain CCMP2298" /LENGTH=100 /DNA_ID=CAMNT_0014122883 /DNA_START=81 /DNA_END=383 /DNA_ORIENTATION=+